MKIKLAPSAKFAAVVLLVSTLSFQSSNLFAQVSAFTYQGRLNINGAPADGFYDFMFRLMDAATNGTAAPVIPVNPSVPVTNGLFTTGLDFGAENFTGSPQWLEISVRTNGPGAFTTLTPRTLLLPTPYAIRALSASNLLGTLPSVQLSGAVASANFSGVYGNAVTLNNAANQLSGAFTGNGGGLSNVNASLLGGRSASQFWTTTGNSNTVAGVNFLGTRDFQPLELWAGGLRVLRLEPDTRGDIAGNVIGGSTNNAVEQPGTGGSVIAGGGYRFGPNLIHFNSSGTFIGAGSGNGVGPNVGDSFLGGGFGNQILPPANRAVIGGGLNNTNSGYLSVIVGGTLNGIGAPAEESFIGGGSQNQIVGSAINQVAGTIAGGSLNHIFTNGTLGTIAGGFNNNIQADTDGGTIGGGYDGSVDGNYATVPGGLANAANGLTSFAAGRRAKASHDGTFVWADSQDVDFNSTATNQFSVRAKGGARFETAGAGLKVDGQPVATTNAALLSASQTFSGQNTFNNSVGINGSLSASTVTPAGTLTVAGDISMSGGATTYHNLSMPGGNSTGFLYGSFPALGDGIHLGYNFYADSGGGPHVINAGGGTSRISAGYGEIILAVGGANAAPSGVRLDATLAGVTVFGTFNNLSDRNAKQDFAPVNPSQILEKVAQLPVSEWSYKTDAATRHIGPTAQDFHAAFNIGTDDKHIAPIDEGGVALAAIQGLNEKLEVGSQNSENRSRKLEKRLQQKEAEITELKQRLEKLEQLMAQKLNGGASALTSGIRVAGKP